MGTDKWGHFIQQGYWLYQAVQLGLLNESEIDEMSRWWEGDPETTKDPKLRAKLAKVSRIISRGAVTDFGYYGTYPVGIASRADVAANRLGYEFYRSLDDGSYSSFSTINFSRDQFLQLNEFWNSCWFERGVIETRRSGTLKH